MSLTSVGPKLDEPTTPRKTSPLLSVARRRHTDANSQLRSQGHFSVLEHRVDELSQRLTDLQSEKEFQVEHNHVLHGRLNVILDAVPAGIIVLDSQGRITQHNALARQLLGRDLSDRLWREVSRESFKRRSDDGHEISTLSGKRLSVTTRSVEEGAGQLVLLVDQTETRRLQAQVSHQQRLSALGQMVSALAHQIRTPLSAATLYASHLCDQPLNQTQRSKFSHKLRSRLSHMERQVRDMLLFVKGELPLNDQINRERLMAELNEALEVPVSEAKGHIDWQIQGPNFNLRCNSDALVNAVLNLVNNAFQAYDELPKPASSKRIELTVQTVDDQLAITVRDFGPGISDPLLAKLSQPFVTTKAQGTGLGLSVVRAVVNAHFGTMQIRQAQPGVAVHLELPCQQASF